MPGACRARIFVCIEVEMSDANVVCANVYIRIRTTRRRRRVNPGHAPMKGAIMHFSLGDDRGRARLKGPLTRAASRLLPGRQSPPGHYRTHLAICRCEARQVRAPPPSPPRLPAPNRVLRPGNSFGDRAVVVALMSASVCRVGRRFNFYRTPLSDQRQAGTGTGWWRLDGNVTDRQTDGRTDGNMTRTQYQSTRHVPSERTSFITRSSTSV